MKTDMTTPTNPEPAERAKATRTLEDIEAQIISERRYSAFCGEVEDSPFIEQLVAEREELMRELEAQPTPKRRHFCDSCGQRHEREVDCPTTDPAPTAAETITPEELRAQLDDMLAKAAAAESQGETGTPEWANMVIAINEAGVLNAQELVIHCRGLRAQLAQVTAELDEARHLCDAQANLLNNINDTLRGRGFPGQFRTDERVIQLAQSRDDLKARLDAANEDSERLDWIAKNPERSLEMRNTGMGRPMWRCFDDASKDGYGSPREAIDAARKQQH